MMPTHQKKPLTASCIQWRGDNYDDFAEWCATFGINVQQHVSGHPSESVWLIMRGTLICGCPPNYWIVRQENGKIRTYSPERFNSICSEFLEVGKNVRSESVTIVIDIVVGSELRAAIDEMILLCRADGLQDV